MKRFVSVIVLLCAALVPAVSLDLAIDARASSFAFDSDGDIGDPMPAFGGSVTVSDRLSDRMDGVFSLERDPLAGNVLSTRVTWRSSYLEISGGPSFGILNSSRRDSGVPVLFQPGLALGFAFTLPGLFVASADTDFAIPAVEATNGQVYVQKASLSAGFFLPHVLCQAVISQRTNIRSSDTDPLTKSVTDYGFYTESFKKGAPFRLNVNFIYRVLDYYVSSGSAANREIGNLVLGGALTWAPHSDFSLFIDGSGALYSFSLKDSVPNLDHFMYDVRAGMSVHIAEKTAD